MTINVMRIITRLNIGGPSIHALVLSRGLKMWGIKTTLVVGTPALTEGDLTTQAEQTGVHVVRVHALKRALRPWADLCALVSLVRLIVEVRPTIIHTHMAKAGTLGRLAGLLYNWWGPGRRPGARAVLIHTFHGHVFEGYFGSWLTRGFILVEQWLARHTDCLIAVSPAIQDQLLERGIGRPEQWRVIALGLDLSPYAELALPNGASLIRIGLVGRLVPVKNPHLFLEAFERLAARGLAASCQGLIVGDGPLRAELEQEVERSGLADRVRFTGWQQDLRSVYDSVAVTCVTSWNEGTPVALIEAMAAGRTVVATDVGGVRDVLLGEGGEAPSAIEPGTFHVTSRGVLVRAGDAEGLMAALAMVTTDAPLRKRLGLAARAAVLKQFSAERLCQELVMVYAELVSRRCRCTH